MSNDYGGFYFAGYPGAASTSSTASGSIGPPGPAGPVGATGPAGMGVASGAMISCVSLTAGTGSFGALYLNGQSMSATGPSGAAGSVGATGPSGAAGSVGATGPSGAAGNVGATGPSGAAGSVGATGPSGAAGNVGATGPSGAAGNVGATGPAGSFTGTTSNASIVNLSAGTGAFVSLYAATGSFNQLYATGAYIASLTGINHSCTVLNAGTGVFTQLSTSKNIQDDGAGNATVSSQLTLSNSNTPIVMTQVGSFANPSLAPRSSGTKIVLNPQLSGATVDTAIGCGVGSLWHSVPTNNNNNSFQWFGGLTGCATLTGGGNLTVTGSLASGKSSLDDGTGKAQFNGAVQIQPSAASTSCVIVAQNAGSTATTIQGYNSGSASFPIQLNPGGGSVSTSKTILDDGFGGLNTPGTGSFGQLVSTGASLAAISGASLNYNNATLGTATTTGNVSVNPTSTGVSKLSLFGSIASPTGYFYGFGAINNQLQNNSQGSHAWFTQSSPQTAQTTLMVLSSGGALSTTTATGVSRNTLDDGSGNMKVAGTLTSSGQGVVTNQFYVSTNPVTTSTNASFLNVQSFGTTNVAPLQVFQPSSAAGNVVSANIGVSNNNFNTGYLLFKNVLAGSTTNYTQIGIAGASNSLQMYGSNAIKTLNNTLDDGSGNMSIGGNVVVGGTGSFNGQIWAAGPITSFPAGNALTLGTYQSTPTMWATSAGAVTGAKVVCTSFSTSTNTGIVRNTLDDGFGNLTATSLQCSGQLSSGVLTTPGIGIGSLRGGLAATTGCFLQGYQGTGALAYIPLNLNGLGGGVYTSSNILDDGVGNATIGGVSTTLRGVVTIKSNQLANASGALINMPSSAGTLALQGYLAYGGIGGTGSNINLTLVGSSGGFSLGTSNQSIVFPTGAGAPGQYQVNWSFTGQVAASSAAVVTLSLGSATAYSSSLNASVSNPSGTAAVWTANGQSIINNPGTMAFTTSNFNAAPQGASFIVRGLI